MEGLSRKEVELIAELEFDGKSYFTTKDVLPYFEDKKQMTNTIYRLRKKGRIVRLNRTKYFLIPIKARTGKWTDDPLIITDEICNGQAYFIGGWYAAHYWRLTDQIPMQVDVYTTRRQGKIVLLNKRLVFHRTSKKNLEKAVIERIDSHTFKVLSYNETKKWMKSRR